MSLSAEKYVIKYKIELFKLYSAFYSGLELDIALYEKTVDQEMQKRACYLAVLSHKNKDFELNFSLDKEVASSKSDVILSDELFSVTLCEEQVKIGNLKRAGDFYISDSSEKFKTIPKYKKYIRII
jgi:hypothetical protein